MIFISILIQLIMWLVVIFYIGSHFDYDEDDNYNDAKAFVDSDDENDVDTDDSDNENGTEYDSYVVNDAYVVSE